MDERLPEIFGSLGRLLDAAGVSPEKSAEIVERQLALFVVDVDEPLRDKVDALKVSVDALGSEWQSQYKDLSDEVRAISCIASTPCPYCSSSYFVSGRRYGVLVALLALIMVLNFVLLAGAALLLLVSLDWDAALLFPLVK